MALFAATTVFTFRWDVGSMDEFNPITPAIRMEHGALQMRTNAPWAREPAMDVWRHRQAFAPRWWPAMSGNDDDGWLVVAPLWLGLAAVAIPAVWLGRSCGRDRRVGVWIQDASGGAAIMALLLLGTIFVFLSWAVRSAMESAMVVGPTALIVFGGLAAVWVVGWRAGRRSERSER